MSTILDALKKSEQERKLSDVPKLSDMPVPQESARWPLVVIAILSLVLALVVGILLSQWFSRSEQTSVQQASQPVVANSVAAEAPISSADGVVVNVVSYSDVPAQRFVMLDGKMYRENDFVRAGLKVEEIQPNAVVLNLRGELITRTP